MQTPLLIDSHAHLSSKRFAQDLPAVLARASEASVDLIMTIATDLASSHEALALAHAHPRIFASAGVHPHDADAFKDTDWPTLVALFDDPKVRAVGETGLDYYYDYSDRERQKELFRRHLELCAVVERPIVVHIRDAFDDAFALIADVGLPAGGVLHCFTGGIEQCARALELGFHISLSGIATFKSAKALRAAVPTIPSNRLLVETDSPFLAPTPHRGRRNEPAYVVDVAKEVARLRGDDFADLCQFTRRNTIELFKIPGYSDRKSTAG